MNLVPGQLVGGHYKIICLLGIGNFGETYQAENLHAKSRKCAVKHLKFTSSNSSAFNKARELFEREAEVLLKLTESANNSHIPRFFAYFDENQQFYLVQEFIAGHTLSEELQQRSRLTEDEVLDLLEDVLETLQFIHSQGIIHRDIKPDNLIRRERDNRIVLIDFGAVKEVVAQSKPQHRPTVIYTQGYAPPEQYQGQPQFNSDIYALGMTALEVLTGLETENLKDPNEGKVKWPSQIKINQQLAKIIEKMVDEDYKRRYQSASNVINAIKKIKSTQLVLPSINSVISTNIQSKKIPNLIPQWLFVAVLGLIVTVLGVIVSFLFAREIITSPPTTSPTQTVTPKPTLSPRESVSPPSKPQKSCPPFIGINDECSP
jgi:serine/threonine protein kinase